MAAFRWAWRAFPWRWGNSRAVLDRALNDEKLMQLSLKQCNTRCISKYLWPMSIYIYIYLNKYNTYILSGCWYFLTCVLIITWLLFLCLEATSIAGGEFLRVLFFADFDRKVSLGIFFGEQHICWSNILHAQTQLKMKIQWVVFQVFGGNCVFFWRWLYPKLVVC